MVEKLGRWYVFPIKESYGYRYRIHEKNVKNGIVNLYFDGIGRIDVNIFDVKYIDLDTYHGINDMSHIMAFNDGTAKIVNKNCSVEIRSLNIEHYEELLDMNEIMQRNKKLEQQVEKLTAHVLALMINNGNLDVNYGGEFP